MSEGAHFSPLPGSVVKTWPPGASAFLLQLESTVGLLLRRPGPRMSKSPRRLGFTSGTKAIGLRRALVGSAHRRSSPGDLRLGSAAGIPGTRDQAHPPSPPVTSARGHWAELCPLRPQGPRAGLQLVTHKRQSPSDWRHTRPGCRAWLCATWGTFLKPV